MFQIIEQIPAIIWIVLGIGCFAWVTFISLRLVKFFKLIRSYKAGDLLDICEKRMLEKIYRLEKIIVRKKEK